MNQKTLTTIGEFIFTLMNWGFAIALLPYVIDLFSCKQWLAAISISLAMLMFSYFTVKRDVL